MDCADFGEENCGVTLFLQHLPSAFFQKLMPAATACFQIVLFRLLLFQLLQTVLIRTPYLFPTTTFIRIQVFTCHWCPFQGKSATIHINTNKNDDLLAAFPLSQPDAANTQNNRPNLEQTTPLEPPTTSPAEQRHLAIQTILPGQRTASQRTPIHKWTSPLWPTTTSLVAKVDQIQVDLRFLQLLLQLSNNSEIDR